MTTQRRGRGDAGSPLNVLVVDDSAVVRRFMSQLLEQERGMAVETAADPLIAIRKMERFRPDVILLDLEMPRMGGLTFLASLMRDDPIPVVICSSHTGVGTETALRALEEGAVEVLAKPRVGVSEFLHESALLLIDTLQAAAKVRVHRRPIELVRPVPRLTADAVLPQVRAPSRGFGQDRIIAIGASTGGPEALRAVLGALPLECPGILIVQHMPKPFTGAFAARLDEVCSIEIREAEDEDRVVEGRALIAPGDRHLIVVRHGDSYVVRLDEGPLVSRHRPSIDVLFRSVAQAAGPNAVGVVLTGMGDDGAAGLAEMKQAGAATLAQDESTSIVFGIPGEAIKRGAVDLVAPLERLPALILSRAAARSTARLPASR